jgi:hypothetical protein
MKAARKTKSPVSEELSARARAYWTPERRAEQGVHCEAHSIGAEAYNAVMKACSNSEAAREAMRAAYAAAYEFLMKPAAFAARVERKRAELASKPRRSASIPIRFPAPNAPTSSLVH